MKQPFVITRTDFKNLTNIRQKKARYWFQTLHDTDDIGFVTVQEINQKLKSYEKQSNNSQYLLESFQNTTKALLTHIHNSLNEAKCYLNLLTIGQVLNTWGALNEYINTHGKLPDIVLDWLRSGFNLTSTSHSHAQNEKNFEDLIASVKKLITSEEIKDPSYNLIKGLEEELIIYSERTPKESGPVAIEIVDQRGNKLIGDGGSLLSKRDISNMINFTLVDKGNVSHDLNDLSADIDLARILQEHCSDDFGGQRTIQTVRKGMTANPYLTGFKNKMLSNSQTYSNSQTFSNHSNAESEKAADVEEKLREERSKSATSNSTTNSSYVKSDSFVNEDEQHEALIGSMYASLNSQPRNFEEEFKKNSPISKLALQSQSLSPDTSITETLPKSSDTNSLSNKKKNKKRKTKNKTGSKISEDDVKVAHESKNELVLNKQETLLLEKFVETIKPLIKSWIKEEMQTLTTNKTT